MSTERLILAFIIISIASIGIAAFNANDTYKTEHSCQFTILLLVLLIAIFGALLSMYNIVTTNDKWKKKMQDIRDK